MRTFHSTSTITNMSQQILLLLSFLHTHDLARIKKKLTLNWFDLNMRAGCPNCISPVMVSTLIWTCLGRKVLLFLISNLCYYSSECADCFRFWLLFVLALFLMQFVEKLEVFSLLFAVVWIELWLTAGEAERSTNWLLVFADEWQSVDACEIWQSQALWAHWVVG